ncbi:hypothetical protein ACRRTK_016076 [Alexandromys fortis]
MDRHLASAGSRGELGRLLQAVLTSRGQANAVFDILAALQSEDPEDIQEGVRTCSRLFGTLLEREELFVGSLPPEDGVLAGSQGATHKYKVWMRHRYHSCCNRLEELLTHPSFQVKELALKTLMKFVQLEGAKPLEKPQWESHYLFPRTLFRAVVGGLLTPEDDHSLLISQFCEYLEYDDIQYHTMQAATSTVAQATSQQSELPLSLYKKVLVAMHDSILPHLAQPTLMIDFLTSACDVGGAISLLALNGLFLLIHKHNLEYPDFYQKLYGLLDPSIFHVKYRARFFHLADLFLSSSHLPAYLVAAFAKRLARLALTAPPEALLMVLPFICNLLRRHPACRVMVHRPQGISEQLDADPYDPVEKDPARSHALESCLWELQTLQQHYHPEVSRAAGVINQVLSVPEVSIAPLLELTAYEIFEQDLKKKAPGSVPLEFISSKGLLGRQDHLCTQFFTLT